MAVADFAWGIVGPGAIAHRFAQAVTALPGHRLHAAWGRDPGRTQAFAQRWAVAGAPAPQAAASLDALLADPALDAVYIATPHPQHAVAAAAALRAGRAVLCEKPLTPTAADTAALLALSASRGVCLMEALWTRLLPLYDQIGARIRAGAIGEIRHIEASFGFAVAEDPASRLFDPALAGGALLDIGIYPLAMIRWALQAERRACPEPAEWSVHGERAATGVDRRVRGRLRWSDGVVADFRCGFDAPDDNALRLVGTRGRIDVPHEFWQATHAVWTDADGRTEALHAPFAVNGFEYEVAEVARVVREGRTESPRMPHAESLALARWLDRCRAAVGVRYPFEP